MKRLIQLLDTAVQREVFAHDRDTIAVNVSGGLDSSTVCRIARKWMPAMWAFTGYYDRGDGKGIPGFDERRYARMATGGTQHIEIPITPDDFVASFDEMCAAFTPPYQGVGMFGQYMVGKQIRASHSMVTTVLSGEGSDELFGGYARLMHVAGTRLPDGYDNYLPPPEYPTKLNAALQFDYDQLPGLLKVDDEALGAFNIRAAAPFTDQRVVEFALALPDTFRVGKTYLREAVRGLVPDPIIDRTDKMGMPAPFVQWANEVGNPVRSFVKDRLGYLPAADQPWDRKWFHELIEVSRFAVAA